MGLNYRNLDAETRRFMLVEIDLDTGNGTLYLSPWLSPRGCDDYPMLLRGAAEAGNDDSLAAELRRNGRINETAQRKKPKGGGMVTYRVPVTAPETMAEGEFNRFYVRGLCLRAIEGGIVELVIYRAKAVMNPRPGSEEKIGTRVNAAAVLNDLRNSPGVEPALGIPPGPNSGLCCHLP